MFQRLKEAEVVEQLPAGVGGSIGRLNFSLDKLSRGCAFLIRTRSPLAQCIISPNEPQFRTHPSKIIYHHALASSNKQHGETFTHGATYQSGGYLKDRRPGLNT